MTPINAKLRINLQLFAGEKTEKATQKKRQDARKKGQVLQSKDVGTAVVLLAVFASLRLLGGYMFDNITGFLKKIINDYMNKQDVYSMGMITSLYTESVKVMFLTCGPILAIAMFSGMMTNYLQVGVLFTTETLMPKFSKLNPLSGVKRMFSMRSFVELFKAVIKICIVSYVVYSYLSSEVTNIMILMDMTVAEAAVYIGSTIVGVALRICIALIVLSFIDYGYQWWQHEKDLKMSKEEIKEEYKQVEGNPEIKSRIRQKQRQSAMRRMMQDVPTADVVITNPTHFAVALKYEQEKTDAPIVVAKGADYLAQRIKEIAKTNNVEIVENKPLARSLYDTAEVGKKIPKELYQAVAEVLAFVYNLKRNR